MIANAISAVFRFDAQRHEYIDPGNGETFPHITGMLEATGWVDSEWYTEESRIRGQAVHRLTAEYDLGALHVESCTSRYRGWLLAHVELMGKLKPEILAVEEPSVHPVNRYGGRPDRVWRWGGALGIPEIKSGTYEKAHPVQTALQAILVAPRYGLKPEMFQRFGLYLRGNGRGCIQQFNDRRDFDEAYRIIKRCC